MYHKHHTKGLILESRGEGDQSIRAKVLTENFGLLSVKVQGARFLSSKLKSGCQEFSLSSFSFVKGKTGWKMVSAEAEKNYFEILKNSPEKLIVMGNVLNLSKKLLSGEEKDEKVFSAIVNFLSLLEKTPGAMVPILEGISLMRILHILGYMKADPDLLAPVSASEIVMSDLETIAPRRARIVSLINESLKASQI
ncbi:MAG TPA: DNA repair protein RecO [Candidatus Paceibacterota bacterium]